jgi:hypothetical protein
MNKSILSLAILGAMAIQPLVVCAERNQPLERAPAGSQSRKSCCGGGTAQSGKPYQLDTDYFGNKWPENRPSPEPFALTGEKEIRVKVWPKKSHK